MFAVIRTGGKQYKVQKGDKLRVDKLDADAGKNVKIDEVLFIGGDKKAVMGTPLVKGAEVSLKVLDHVRGPKITVFKKKRRQNYRRKKGHRQDLTLVEITDIKAA